tara:strand:+ start:16031 stop:16201 length:171 start_codon:yes stop_codon:yes gene_type:complete
MADQISITVTRDAEKKNSVVYRGESESGFRYSLYIGRDDLHELGNPKALTLGLASA